MDSHSPVGACTMAGTGVAGTPMIADMADEMEKEANKALEDIETKGSFSKLPGFTPWSQEHGLVGWRFLWKYEDDDSETFWAHVTGWLPATLNDGRDYWQAKFEQYGDLFEIDDTDLEKARALMKADPKAAGTEQEGEGTGSGSGSGSHMRRREKMRPRQSFTHQLYTAACHAQPPYPEPPSNVSVDAALTITSTASDAALTITRKAVSESPRAHTWLLLKRSKSSEDDTTRSGAAGGASGGAGGRQKKKTSGSGEGLRITAPGKVSSDKGSRSPRGSGGPVVDRSMLNQNHKAGRQQSWATASPRGNKTKGQGQGQGQGHFNPSRRQKNQLKSGKRTAPPPSCGPREFYAVHANSGASSSSGGK